MTNNSFQMLNRELTLKTILGKYVPLNTPIDWSHRIGTARTLGGSEVSTRKPDITGWDLKNSCLILTFKPHFLQLHLFIFSSSTGLSCLLVLALKAVFGILIFVFCLMNRTADLLQYCNGLQLLYFFTIK